ncbi:MAG: hypothetical protein WCO25_05520 [Candidatus Uhrbacteria bacterium]
MLRRLLPFFCAVVLLWMPFRALAFAIAPATLDLSGKRGETIKDTIAVINNGSAEQTYYLGTLKFVPGETSTPSFIPFETDHSGLPEWIAFPVKIVSIPANTKVDVPFTVTIPQDAASGTVYAAITVSTSPSQVVASNGATVEAKMASLLFVTVEGETVEKLALLDLSSSNAADGPFDLARQFVFRVQNQGNVASVPTGTITLTDALGRLVASQPINVEGGRVLPMTTRSFSGSIGPNPVGFVESVRSQIANFAIGPIHATLVIESGSQALTKSFSYWTFPLHLLLTAAMAVVILLALSKVLSRGRDRLGRIQPGQQ